MNKGNCFSLVFVSTNTFIEAIDKIIVLYLFRLIKKNSLDKLFLIKSSIISIQANVKPALTNKFWIEKFLSASFNNNRYIPFGKLFDLVWMEIWSHTKF